MVGGAMTRKRALILLAIATVALFVVLAVLDLRMADAGGPGIIGFEFAGDEEGAAEILAEWGDEGKDAARASLWIDYLYLLAYGAFLVLACMSTRDLAAARGWRRMAAFGVAVVPIAAAAPSFDAIENIGLLLTLDGRGGDAAPGLAAVCAGLKFAMLALSIGFLLAGLGLRLRDRRASV
jgi:hypothetical protein